MFFRGGVYLMRISALKKMGFLLSLVLIGFFIGIMISTEFNLLPWLKGERYYYEADKSSNNYKEYSKAFIEAANKVKSSVVNIYTEKIIKSRIIEDPFFDLFNDEFFKRFFDIPEYSHKPQEREFKVTYLGSGFIVNPEGYILTNSHVVKDADNIKVKLINGKIYEAKLVGLDEKSDIAVLKIENNGDLSWAKLGDSDRIEVGEWVVAVGNPFGLSHTVTAGIVSALGRSSMHIIPEGYEDFIQTDVAINTGNSGGPLINLNGDVIGINTAIYSRTGTYMGIGFAIPINMAKKVMMDLITKGEVERGYLGVYIQDVTPEIALKLGLSENTRGVLISEVISNSPSYKAGLKQGDVILSFNGKKVSDASQLRNIVANTSIGERVEIEFIRDGKKKSVYVTIEKQPSDIQTSKLIPKGRAEDKNLGISVSNITDDLRKEYSLDPSEKGVVIIEIEAGGYADNSGLKAGDIIIEIDRNAIDDVKDFERVMKSQSSSSTFLFLIKRGSHYLYLVVKK
ncbi:MAG: DegQ family serine endoprotease [Candidatus Hydrogenedentota bacterium]